ncbi:MAG: hypothetical protein Unbinned1068contig1000_34 [Prokaryotic dsDNA virus sp.]|nr:MAG: hypothetical protein Unbinned1068contig1000_34 [Prokaryotic dsDNA virus sp.]|tara:strand:+ start:4663 stop:11943 length:7281 start_codon:yes stop_codon:yes gene_type:complete
MGFPKEDTPTDSGFRNFLRQTWNNISSGTNNYTGVPTENFLDLSTSESKRKRKEITDQTIRRLRDAYDTAQKTPSNFNILRIGAERGLNYGFNAVKKGFDSIPDPVKQFSSDIAPSSDIVVPILNTVLDPGTYFPALDYIQEWTQSKQQNKEERQKHMTGVQKFNDNLANIISLPEFGEIAGKSYQRYIKQEEIDGEIFSELDKSYLEPVLPVEFTNYVTENFGAEAGFVAESFRQNTAPLDIHITIAAMMAYSPKPTGTGVSGAIKQTVYDKNYGAIAKNEINKDIVQANLGARYRPYPINNKVITSPAKQNRFKGAVGNVLKPFGYHTPGLKGMLQRGGSELALGTAFVSGMRGIDAAIEKHNPEFREKSPVANALLSFGGALALTGGGIAGGQISYGLGRAGVKQVSSIIPGTRSNLSKKKTQEYLEKLNMYFERPITGGSDGNIVPRVDPLSIVIKEMKKEFADTKLQTSKSTTELLKILNKYDVESPKNNIQNYVEALMDDENANVYKTLKTEITESQEYLQLSDSDKLAIESIIEGHKAQIELIQNTYYDTLQTSGELIKKMQDYLSDQKVKFDDAKNPFPKTMEEQFTPLRVNGQGRQILEGRRAITPNDIIGNIYNELGDELKKAMTAIRKLPKEQQFHARGQLAKDAFLDYIQNYNRTVAQFGEPQRPPIKLEWKDTIASAKKFFGEDFVSRTNDIRLRNIITDLDRSRIQIQGSVTDPLETRLANAREKYGFVTFNENQWKAIIRELRGTLEHFDTNVESITDEYRNTTLKELGDLAVKATESNEGYYSITQNLLDDPKYFAGEVDSTGKQKFTAEDLTKKKTETTEVTTDQEPAPEFFNISNDTLRKNYIDSLQEKTRFVNSVFAGLTKNASGDEWADILRIPKITDRSGKKKAASQTIRTKYGDQIKKILVTGINLDSRQISQWQYDQLQEVLKDLKETRKIAGNLKIISQYKTAINRILNNYQIQKHATWKRGLFNEAQKYDNYQDFENSVFKEFKNGRYYHVTKDQNFWINPDKGPQDLAKEATGSKPHKGALMITSDLENWNDFYNKQVTSKGEQVSRDFVAIVDMSQVPAKDYNFLDRGFGNEFFIRPRISNKARVIKVVPIEEALDDSKKFKEEFKANIKTKDDLKRFYDEANQRFEEATSENLAKATKQGFSGKKPPSDVEKLQGGDQIAEVKTELVPKSKDVGEYKALDKKDPIDGSQRTLTADFLDARGRTKTDHEADVYNNKKPPIDPSELEYDTNLNLDTYWENLAEPQRKQIAGLMSNSISRAVLSPLKFVNPNLYRPNDEIGILRAKFEMWRQKEMALADSYIDRIMYSMQQHFMFNIKGSGLSKKLFRKGPLGQRIKKIIFGGFGEELDGKALNLKYSDKLVAKDKEGKIIARYEFDKRQLENVDMDDYERTLVREKWLIDNNAYASSYSRTIHDIVNSLDPKHPSYNRYDLTQDQRALLESIQKHQNAQYRKIGELFDRLKFEDPGMKTKIIANEKEYYFHRIVTKRPDKNEQSFTSRIMDTLGLQASRTSGVQGSKTDFIKNRLFEDIDDLLDEGYEVVMNPKYALQSRFHQGIDLLGRSIVQRRLEETAPLKRRSDIYAESKIKAELDNEKAQIQKELSDRLATYNGVRRRINAIEKRKTRPPEIQQEYQELLAQEQTQHPIVVHLKARKDELDKRETGIRQNFMRTKYGESTILGKPIPKEVEESVQKNFGDLFDYTQNKNSITGPPLDFIQGLRAFLTTGELSVMGIQLGKLIVNDPVILAKAMFNSTIKHVESPYAYIEKNYEAVVTGIKWGAVSLPTEFMYTGGISNFPTQIPVLGAYLDATNQFFEKAVFVAQVELWKAATEIKKISDLQKNARRVGSFLPGIRDASLLQRHGIASRAELLGDLNALKQDGVDVDRFRKDLADLGSAIRRDVGTENYAQIGVYGKQADFEQFAAFAARFFRAIMSQFYTSFRGGEAGRYARRSMAGFIGGMGLLGVAITYKSTGKMMNIDNPDRSDYLHAVLPDGTQFPIYGAYHPFLRTFARSSNHANKGDFEKIDDEFIRLLEGKAGIGLNGLLSFAELINTGEIRTYDGEIIDVSANGLYVLSKERIPIIAQELGESLVAERDETKEQLGIPLDEPRYWSIIEFLGFNAKDPETLNNERNRISQKLYGKDYSEILDEGDAVALAKINNDPGVELVRLESAMQFGGYREEAAKIEALYYYKQMSLLNQLFYTVDGKPRDITAASIREFRRDSQETADYIRGRRDQNRETNGADFLDETRNDPRNQNEAALYDYYEIIDNSVRNQVFDGALFVELIEEQEKKWTDEQNEYIKEYRARKTYAPGYEYLSDFNNPLNGAEYDKAIREARITAKGGNAGYLNLARLYIYKKYLDPNPNDGLLDIRQERNEPVATPTPRPTLSEALGEPELFPEFK